MNCWQVPADSPPACLRTLTNAAAKTALVAAVWDVGELSAGLLLASCSGAISERCSQVLKPALYKPPPLTAPHLPTSS